MKMIAHLVAVRELLKVRRQATRPYRILVPRLVQGRAMQDIILEGARDQPGLLAAEPNAATSDHTAVGLMLCIDTHTYIN